MADVLALVSKAVFDKAAREAGLDVGVVWRIASYASAVKGLSPLAEGGRLFLATVRPPDEALWLVGILEQPKFDGGRWSAKPNATAIRDVSAHKRSLKFATGAGLPTEAGKLGMSLQTPRVLTEDDAKLLADERAKNADATRATAAKIGNASAKPAKTAGRKSSPKRADATAAGPAPEIDQEAVLARWRKTRSPRLADLLCCVPVDDALADRLAKIPRANTDSAMRRLRQLPDDDPRVTVFLVKLLQKANWPGSGAKVLWKNVFAKLVALKDRRAVAPLRAMVATPPYFLGAGFTRWCVEQIGATADTLAKQKQTADDAETKRLADAQVATVPAGGWFAVATRSNANADALIAKVWAAPDDLPLRSVIGDALLELGDPWGELIALQANAKKPDRQAINKLVRKHGSRLAGGIAHVSHREQMTFEHGFLASCPIGRGMVGRRLWEEAVKAPHWATVRSVNIGTWGETPKWWFKAWLASAPLVSLREIEIGNVVLARSSASAPWTFAKLPKKLEWGVEDTLKGLLRGLPVAELKKLVTPSSTPKMNEMIADAIEDLS